MPDSSPPIIVATPRRDDALALNRAAVRATSDFFLSTAEVAAAVADYDLGLGIIWLTVVERSARLAQRSPEKWTAYVRSGKVLPDEGRPPISVYAIAHILSQPYETTRRAVGRLIAKGMLAKVRKGVIAPAAFMDSAKVRVANLDLQTRLRRWLISLDRQGLIQLGGGANGLWPSLTEPGPSEDVDPYADETRRKYSRLALGFTIEAGRIVAGLADGNLLQGLLLVAIVQANVGRLSADSSLSRQFGDYLHPPPDGIRRPISIFALAQSLHLPYETVRRNVIQLVNDGLVERSNRGVVVPTAVVMQDKVVAASAASNNLFKGFIGALAASGLDIALTG